MNMPNDASQTELAIERQPGLLGLDWAARIGKPAKAAARGAKSVTFVGTGSSYNAALWAASLARRTSDGALEANAVTTWDFLTDDSARRAPSTRLFVVISHRGARDLTKRALAMIGRKRRVLICAEGAPTGGHAHVRTSQPEVAAAHTMSLIAAMAACSELIACTLPTPRAKQLRESREKLAMILQAVTMDGQELFEALGGILTRGAGLHFVGGGAFHAVALELALKAQEIAHIPAHGYNTEEFLHGPMTAVAEDDTVVALKPLSLGGAAAKSVPAATSKLLNLERLAACRRAAEAVAALVLEPSWEPNILREAGRLSAPWQALLSLYWGQILCLSAAKSWGVNPDAGRRDDPRYDEAYQRCKL